MKQEGKKNISEINGPHLIYIYTALGASHLDKHGDMEEIQLEINRIREKENRTYRGLIDCSEEELVEYGVKTAYNSESFRTDVLPAFRNIEPFVANKIRSLAELVINDIEKKILVKVDAQLKPKMKSITLKERMKEWQNTEVGCVLKMPSLVADFSVILAGKLSIYHSRLNSARQVARGDISYQVNEAFEEFFYRLFPPPHFTRSVR